MEEKKDKKIKKEIISRISFPVDLVREFFLKKIKREEKPKEK